ncbi:hypothetical protein BKA65DRAFT_497691 [Rhexocercosporidium sp. MPI-PUGE-AT-0058]|nr:hypothetical protein BKA65DRAFT_497691 [Rhexocercosporidium sp. MPI-PUGE-AT-0058]
MLYNNAILSVLAASTSLISTSFAAPVNARESAPSCPTGTQYYDYESTSGFRGCTATPAEYQNGPRKYWQSCPTGHGNWYVCATGFKGCTTNTTICDPKSTAPVPGSDPITPPVDPTICSAGQSYYVCANGFKGCSSDSTVCDPKPVDPIVHPDGTWNCPAGQTYYNCATGFKGCGWDHTVCDPKTPVDPKPIDPKPVDPSTGNNGFCPAGTSYYDYESTSGFKGCTSTPAAYENGPRIYWGSCPTGLGNWYVCANGFKGCNTNTAVCDLKA